MEHFISKMLDILVLFQQRVKNDDLLLEPLPRMLIIIYMNVGFYLLTQIVDLK